MHLLDVTMFWAPESGGVRTYLEAKRDWMKSRSVVQHSLLVPGSHRAVDQATCKLYAPPIPFGQGYRFPLRNRPWVRAMHQLQPDLIEVADPYRLAWATLEAGHDLQVPTVGFYHSDLISLIGKEAGAWTTPWVSRYVQNLYRRFDWVLAPSQAMADKLAALQIERVLVQPLGVDASLFHPAKCDPAVRQQLGLADTTRLLVFAGRNSAEKNIPVLLDAMKLLGPDYHLHLVGSHMPDELPDNVSRHNRFVDKTQLARLLASSDMLLHAGDCETFGLVLLEAMSCGIPVVGVDAGSVPELVVEGTGRLAIPHSASSLATEVSALFEGNIREMGRAAREHVELRYDWHTLMPRLLNRYRSMVREPSAVMQLANA